jgi:electron transport complex protein RnfE
MGVATTFVLVFSNLLISLLRNVIPSKVRIACYIVIIATFVTIVELVMQAYTYELFLKLGIFIPLIVVNCIVLGRAEAFASKNGPVLSILGSGTITIWGGTPVFEMGANFLPFQFMIEAPGAFVGLGLMLCMMNLIGKK